MSVFDLGKNIRTLPDGAMVYLPDNEQEGDSARYEWVMATQTGWCRIGDSFFGNPTAFVRSVHDKLSKIQDIPFSDTDRRDLIVLLERTALELRELIGEE